ncbi:galactinol synthase 1-like [Pyrus ussuriensis x Pyrus communis]|uniref:Galactinol synthase 1-like n=1 Tax=Pyrus ussuriensis x Pyrus communis TaxID=2448454 RepID=A0A5N5G8N7_9ROSA|nr:galactinol synthase 1-like [Pyrus ussuriensis x Pyrus communis]
MIYLDGDIEVYDNIDHLFDLPDGHFYAVMDCFCEKTWSHTPQYQIGYCQQCPEKGSKPWRYTGKEENMQREDIKMLVKKWWDIYNDESLDYRKAAGGAGAGGVVAPEAASGGEGVNMQPFIDARSGAAVQYVTAPSAA